MAKKAAPKAAEPKAAPASAEKKAAKPRTKAEIFAKLAETTRSVEEADRQRSSTACPS